MNRATSVHALTHVHTTVTWEAGPFGRSPGDPYSLWWTHPETGAVVARYGGMRR